MSISFAEVPSNARVPGVYIEIDNSLANSATQTQRVLVMGDPVEGSPVATDTPMLCMNADEAKTMFGNGSPLHQMMVFLDKQNITLPVYAVSIGSNGVAGALAALGDTQYHYVICPKNDAESVRELAEFLEARYTALEMIPGIAFVPKKGTHAELVTFANTCNSPLVSFMPIHQLTDAAGERDLTDGEALAGWAGQIAQSLSIDPCRPLQGLVINGVYTKAVDEFDWQERNLLLHEGMSTYNTNSAKQVMIERVVTAYTENSAGVADDSYLDVMTPATAMFFREKQRSMILSKYPRHKLAKDGTRFAPGQAVVTPSVIAGQLIALYKELEYQGIVQDSEGYKKSLIVMLDENNKSRINYQDSPQFVNGLIIVGGKIQFRK